MDAAARHSQGPSDQPVVVATSGRAFAAQPAAVFVFIFRDDERVLLLRQPDAPGWRPIGGAVEADETILQAAMREVAEEAGAGVRVRPLGVAHAWSYRFDVTIRNMIDVAWVMSYEGGDVVPGSDMAGSDWQWCVPEEVETLLISLPQGTDWLLQRAVEVYRSYRHCPLELEPDG